MENLKVAEEKPRSKREMIKSLMRSRKNVQKAGKSNLSEAIAQLSGGGGGGGGGRVVVSQDDGSGLMRVKILVKKQDLEKVVERLSKSKDVKDHLLSLNSSVVQTTPPSLEQRINLMKRRSSLRRSMVIKASCRGGSCSWRPVLHSIPEEF